MLVDNLCGLREVLNKIKCVKKTNYSRSSDIGSWITSLEAYINPVRSSLFNDVILWPTRQLSKQSIHYLMVLQILSTLLGFFIWWYTILVLIVAIEFHLTNCKKLFSLMVECRLIEDGFDLKAAEDFIEHRNICLLFILEIFISLTNLFSIKLNQFFIID